MQYLSFRFYSYTPADKGSQSESRPQMQVPAFENRAISLSFAPETRSKYTIEYRGVFFPFLNRGTHQPLVSCWESIKVHLCFIQHRIPCSFHYFHVFFPIENALQPKYITASEYTGFVSIHLKVYVFLDVIVIWIRTVLWVSKDLIKWDTVNTKFRFTLNETCSEREEYGKSWWKIGIAVHKVENTDLFTELENSKKKKKVFRDNKVLRDIIISWKKTPQVKP